MNLEIGLFATLPANSGQAIGEIYSEQIQDARLADELGYNYYFFIEHQNADFPVITSPGSYLAALAMTTKRIRLGAMVFQLPMHHPVRLAQETAMVDHLSSGRLDFGIGYGTRKDEFDRWGLDFNTRRERGIEGMEVILKAWKGEEFTHHGEYFDFPRALPSPASRQQPNPPIWVGGHSSRSFDYAAEHNFNLAQNIDTETVAARKFDYFRNALKEWNHSGPAPRTLFVRHVHVAETDEEARAEAEPYMLEGLVGQTGVARAMQMNASNATPEMLEIARIYINSAESYDFWVDEGLAFVGSPETVARAIIKQQELCGYDVLLTHHQITSMPGALARRSMELFGRRVIPALRGEQLAERSRDSVA